MSTYLGAATTLTPFEARAALPEDFDILFIEGYIWDAPHGAAVIETLCQVARAAGARVALTPSDAGCVERNIGVMRNTVSRYVDVLIGNHAEIGVLAGNDSAEAALDWAMSRVSVAAVTEHENGSWVAMRVAGIMCPRRQSRSWSTRPARGTPMPAVFWPD